MRKSFILVLLFVLSARVLLAQQITLHVETAGTLSSMIAESKKDVITDLKLTGNINSSDLYFLRKSMTKLENLDLKDIVLYDFDISNSFLVPTTTLHDYAFYQMYSLKHIALPVNITSIDTGAFDGCNNLESIEIPNNVTEIGNHAFEGCI